MPIVTLFDRFPARRDELTTFRFERSDAEFGVKEKIKLHGSFFEIHPFCPYETSLRGFSKKNCGRPSFRFAKPFRTTPFIIT